MKHTDTGVNILTKLSNLYPMPSKSHTHFEHQSEERRGWGGGQAGPMVNFLLIEILFFKLVIILMLFCEKNWVEKNLVGKRLLVNKVDRE